MAQKSVIFNLLFVIHAVYLLIQNLENNCVNKFMCYLKFIFLRIERDHAYFGCFILILSVCG